MRSLQDVQEKMSDLYEKVETGAMELKKADSLANIAGKYLKAEQMLLAREIFLSGRNRAPLKLPPAEAEQARDVLRVA